MTVSDKADIATRTEAQSHFFSYYRSARTDTPLEEQEMLQRARAFTIDVFGTQVSCWSWGTGKELLLVHGIYGRAAQFRKFVDPLVTAGFRVTGFDAPGHGATRSPFVFGDLVARVITELHRQVGGFEAAVCHSGGCTWFTLAQDHGTCVPRLAFLCPGGGRLGFDLYVALKQLSPSVAMELASLVEGFEGQDLWERSCAPAAARTWSASGLVVHDSNDQIVPVAHARALVEAWPKARLVVQDAGGHLAILNDASVVNAVVSFLREA